MNLHKTFRKDLSIRGAIQDQQTKKKPPQRCIPMRGLVSPDYAGQGSQQHGTGVAVWVSLPAVKGLKGTESPTDARNATGLVCHNTGATNGIGVVQ